MATLIETRRDRRALADEAGMGPFSLPSVLAGVLVGYGAFGVVAAITAGVLNAIGVDTTELTDNDWRQLGIGGAAAVCFVLFLSWFFGGYVAGRMARRAGAMNGLLVFVFGILVAAGVGAVVGTQADSEVVMDNLRSFGIPTSGEEWTAIGSIAGICAVVSMLLGSLLGGMKGERWHGLLVSRAHDATVVEYEPEHMETLDEERERTRRERPELDLRDRDHDGDRIETSETTDRDDRTWARSDDDTFRRV